MASSALTPIFSPSVPGGGRLPTLCQKSRGPDGPISLGPPLGAGPLLLPLASISPEEVGTAHSCAQQTALVYFLSSQRLQKAGELEARSDVTVLLIRCGTFLVQVIPL